MALILKVLRFPLILLVIEVFTLAAVGVGYTKAARALGVPTIGLANFLGALGLCLVLVLTYKALRRWLEGRHDAEFTLPGAARELGQGLLLGAVLFSVSALLVAALGGLEIQGLRGMGNFLSVAAMAVYTGVFEEAVFRGVLLRHIESLLGSWLAIAITALLFGAAHLTNPHASLFAAMAIAVEAGLLLGAAFLLTRRLWLAVGIHAAWNFTQGWVFSIPVSGNDSSLGLLITRNTGPDWLSGGGFGLEASLVTLLVATLGGVWMLRRAIAQGRLVSPAWVS
ncbi:lysostaphin resistance A-like protein [Novosphingobium sp.]|uniref:CPBP family intramembrane glutamic endopeptidase n=1 Tax=Novosphingobium sp. TaxID=1874826 RepID=UPI0035AE3CDB